MHSFATISSSKLKEVNEASTLLSHGNDDDVFAKHGIQLPTHLNTLSRRWASLLLFCILSAICSGPLTSWATLEPILIADYRVFEGRDQKTQLSSVYSVAVGTAVLGLFFAGLAYDRFGPRNLAVFGGFGCSVMMLAMASCISYQSLNKLLFVTYPALTIFGQINLFGAYAWLWLLPESQNTVNSLGSAIIPSLSNMSVLILVVLHNSYRVQLVESFNGLAVICFVSASICYFIVPGKKQNLRYASFVTRYKMGAGAKQRGLGDRFSSFCDTDGGDEYHREEIVNMEITDAVEKKEENVVRFECCSMEIQNVRASWALMFSTYPLENATLLAHVMLLYVFVLFPILDMYPFYCAIFKDEKVATQLVDIFAAIYGLCGAVGAILIGMLMDKFGLLIMFGIIQVATTLVATLLISGEYGVQIGAQILLVVLAQLLSIVVNRFAMLYGPPELYGTYSGIQMAFLGFGQMLLIPAIKLFGSIIYPPSMYQAATRYVMTFSVLGGLSILGGLAMCYVLWLRPPPKPGTVKIKLATVS
eukprot:jgi/Bigna1/75924/fgenesh1_pg.38_\